MSKELRQTIGGILVFLAVVSFIAVLFVPTLYKHLEETGYTQERATEIAGMYGTICLLGGIFLFFIGLGLINKWIPVILLAAWYAHKYAQDDDDDDED